MSTCRSAVERGPLVRVGLASVLGQRDRWDAVGDGGEGAAGVDLGELAGVADQDELGPGVVGGVDEAGEVAGADHGGFVDDEHGAFVEEGPPGVEDADDAVDGLGAGCRRRIGVRPRREPRELRRGP